MSEQIEIEYKTMLTKDEYTILLQHFKKNDKDAYIQKNYYFDTSDHALQVAGCGLRIRKFTQAGEQTLKSPQQIGLLETTDSLTLAEVDELIEAKKIKDHGSVAAKLTLLGINAQHVELFADLTTKRTEVTIPEGLLAIDESWYSGCHDFELELEVSSENAQEDIFLNLLKKLNINYKPSQHKIKRAKEAFDKASR